MKNHNSPLITGMEGKTIVRTHVSDSHGEVLILYFSDGTTLKVCSTFGLMDSSVVPDEDSIYVTVNDVAV